MLKKIMAVLFTGCVFISFSMAVTAENKLTAPLKSPFGIFNQKKETTNGDLNTKTQTKQPETLQIEKTQTEKPTENQKNIKVFNPQNPLGVVYAENMVNKAQFYYDERDIEAAKQTLDSINKWINEATELHTDLFKTISKLENSEIQADIEKNLAIKFAVLRDKALFLESKILISKGDKKRAVSNLVDVVRSQPSTDLGFKAYDMLQELGFTYKIEYKMIEQQSN
ncbi:MAG TPA: hypothetical protein P5556_04035 [Candidatus Gastranaerophilales bacterium]|nr:hypothetical protein [Candidatus Gastranaerophilales bacterium]